MQRQRKWLLKCEQNRKFTNRKRSSFLRENEMKFLEKFNTKHLSLNGNESLKNAETIEENEIESQDIFLEEDDDDDDAGEDEIILNVPEAFDDVEEQDKMQYDFASPSQMPAFIPSEPLNETNDLIPIAESFTCYKYLSKSKKLEMQHSFRKLILDYEKQILDSKLFYVQE